MLQTVSKCEKWKMSTIHSILNKVSFGQALTKCPLLHRNMKKETERKTDKYIYWNFRGLLQFFRAYLVTILKALGIVILYHILYHNGVEVLLKSHLNSYWHKQCGPSMTFWSQYKICFHMCMNTYCIIYVSGYIYVGSELISLLVRTV